MSLPAIPELIEALTKTLAASDLFASVPEGVLSRATAQMEYAEFAPGDVLMQQGDYGDALFLVLSGSVNLSSNAGLRATLEAGSILGELALMADHPRSATVTAGASGAIGSWLSRPRFERLREEFERELAPVTAAIARRLASYQLAAAARGSRLLNSMTPELRSSFLARLEIEPIASGKALMHAGEQGDSLYLIVSGRLRVVEGEKILAELSKGDTVGETSLMTGENRSATVIALRDSLVAALSLAGFRELIQEFPLETMSVLTRQLTERTRQSAAGRTHDQPPVAMAILPLTESMDSAAFTLRLKQALERFGNIRVLSSETPVVRNTNLAAESRLVEWLNDQENNFLHVLYDTGPQEAAHRDARWTSRAMRQADRVFLLANAEEDPSKASERWKSILEGERHSDTQDSALKESDLILLHRDGAALPTGTAQWRTAFPTVRQHHHVRLDRDTDFARVARSIHHRMIGLALGGGFALGIAHVGVIRAMRELKIPIDCVGGTSMGAIVGVQCAMDLADEQMLEMTMAGCAASLRRDYTLPVLSFLSGAKLGRALADYLEHYKIEDLWLPYFSISASLKRASMVVHREGDALRSVLASCRAPVMFPPLPWAGDLLVDGGLVNNIPADIMRATVCGGTVIAVDVAPAGDVIAPEVDSLHVSGWKHARQRWGSTRPSLDLTLMDVLGRIIRLGGVSRAQQIRADADCYLLPPLEGFKGFDFKQGRKIAEVSYHYSLETLGAWMQDHACPW